MEPLWSPVISGNGSGLPTGILDAASSVSVVTAGAGNATSFDYSALVSLIFSVPSQYRAGASWLMSDGLVKATMLIKDSNNRPIWQPSMEDGAPARLLGYPVYAHPDLAAPAASAKSCVFGNFASAYLIRRVDGLVVQRQDELYSSTG